MFLIHPEECFLLDTNSCSNVIKYALLSLFLWRFIASHSLARHGCSSANVRIILSSPLIRNRAPKHWTKPKLPNKARRHVEHVEGAAELIWWTQTSHGEHVPCESYKHLLVGHSVAGATFGHKSVFIKLKPLFINPACKDCFFETTISRHKTEGH